MDNITKLDNLLRNHYGITDRINERYELQMCSFDVYEKLLKARDDFFRFCSQYNFYLLSDDIDIIDILGKEKLLLKFSEEEFEYAYDISVCLSGDNCIMINGFSFIDINMSKKIKENFSIKRFWFYNEVDDDKIDNSVKYNGRYFLSLGTLFIKGNSIQNKELRKACTMLTENYG